MVVTSVRDSRYEVSIANTTARASGVNRKRPTPVSRTTGKNTTQIQSVPTRVGVAIWLAPSRIATSKGLCIAWLRWMFSTSTVASSTSIPTARAIPPSVIVLMVWPLSLSPMIAVRIEGQLDLQALGRHGFDLGNSLLDPVDDCQRRCVRVLDYHQVGRGLAVDSNHVALRLMRVADRRDLAEQHRRVARELHRDLIEVRDRLRTHVDVDVVLAVAHLGLSGWDYHALRCDGAAHVLRRKSVRVERSRIEIDLDGPLHAAERRRRREARNGK